MTGSSRKETSRAAPGTRGAARPAAKDVTAPIPISEFMFGLPLHAMRDWHWFMQTAQQWRAGSLLLANRGQVVAERLVNLTAHHWHSLCSSLENCRISQRRILFAGEGRCCQMDCL